VRSETGTSKTRLRLATASLMGDDVRLTASYLTLAGCKYGQPYRWDLVTRSDAARTAGFGSIGASAEEFTGHPVDWPALMLRTAQCPVTELEWLDLAEPHKDTLATLRRAVTAFAAYRVNVGICGELRPMRKLVHNLRHAAHVLGEVGATLAVESVSFGQAWQPSLMLDLISRADMPNVGYLWDTFQVAYAVEHGELMPDVPADGIAEVQLAGYIGSDAMNRSVWSWHAEAQLHYLRSIAWTGPVDVEVTNPDMRNSSPVEAAHVAAMTAREWSE
jgi:sugar phosphate isomerase/epimerase